MFSQYHKRNSSCLWIKEKKNINQVQHSMLCYSPWIISTSDNRFSDKNRFLLGTNFRITHSMLDSVLAVMLFMIDNKKYRKKKYPRPGVSQK